MFRMLYRDDVRCPLQNRPFLYQRQIYIFFLCDICLLPDKQIHDNIMSSQLL